MSNIVIDPGDLSYTVMKMLSDFNGATNDVLDHAADVAAAHAVAELNIQSPQQSGKYAKEWAYKRGKRARFGGVCQLVVYNEKRYRLTHLLENGHRKVLWGKRTGESVPAKVHIAPVEKATAEEYMELVKEGIRSASK